MKRITFLGLAALLMLGSLAGAEPTKTDALAAAIFAAELLPGCGDPLSDANPLATGEPYLTCGSCSVAACQGLAPGSYCGRNASGTPKYCEAGAVCPGETEFDRRCFCLAI